VRVLGEIFQFHSDLSDKKQGMLMYGSELNKYYSSSTCITGVRHVFVDPLLFTESGMVFYQAVCYSRSTIRRSFLYYDGMYRFSVLISILMFEILGFYPQSIIDL